MAQRCGSREPPHGPGAFWPTWQSLAFSVGRPGVENLLEHSTGGRPDARRVQSDRRGDRRPRTMERSRFFDEFAPVFAHSGKRDFRSDPFNQTSRRTASVYAFVCLCDERKVVTIFMYFEKTRTSSDLSRFSPKRSPSPTHRLSNGPKFREDFRKTVQENIICRFENIDENSHGIRVSPAGDNDTRGVSVASSTNNISVRTVFWERQQLLLFSSRKTAKTYCQIYVHDVFRFSLPSLLSYGFPLSAGPRGGFSFFTT